MVFAGSSSVYSREIKQSSITNTNYVVENRAKLLAFDVSDKPFVLQSSKDGWGKTSGAMMLAIDTLSTKPEAYIIVKDPNGKEVFRGIVRKGNAQAFEFNLEKGYYSISFPSNQGIVVKANLYG